MAVRRAGGGDVPSLPLADGDGNISGWRAKAHGAVKMKPRWEQLCIAVVVGSAMACAPAGVPDRACTAIGCVSAVSFDVGGVSLGADFVGALDAEVCFDGRCATTRWIQKADGSSRGTNGNIEILTGPNNVEVMLVLPDARYDTSTVHDVSLTLRVDGQPPISVERRVTMTRSQPNGAGCEPVCWSVRVEHHV